MLLEGLARVVQGFGEAGGCSLVRYLRPLTQVLVMQPLEEGGAADRCVRGWVGAWVGGWMGGGVDYGREEN